METNRKGHLILITAPMASGKGSLIAYVESVFPQVTKLVSCTTRAKRPQEQEGVDYYFVTPESFQEKIDQDAFIEWVEFSGNRYGTLRSELTHRLEKGEVVINEIDIQGVMKLADLIPQDQQTTIYIDAGNWETLKARALNRAPMTEEELELRYERYVEEVAFKPKANFIIHNDDGEFEEARINMRSIVEGIIARAHTCHE